MASGVAPGAGDVACGLGDRVRARRGRGRGRRTGPCRRVDSASALSVPSIRISAASRAGPRHRLALHERVVLLRTPSACSRRSASRAPRRNASSGGVVDRRERRVVARCVVELGRAAHRARRRRALVGERPGRDVGDRLAGADRHARDRPRGTSRPITAVAQPPPLADGLTSSRRSGCDDREHALLRLAGQDLERLHAGLAQRDRVEVERRRRARRRRRRLAHGAREAGAAEVLQADQQAAFDAARGRPRSGASR